MITCNRKECETIFGTDNIEECVKKYPNDNFVTEEHFPENKILDRTWIIDSIDRTAHFVKNDGLWGCQENSYVSSYHISR